jgi:hypothetical protein
MNYLKRVKFLECLIRTIWHQASKSKRDLTTYEYAEICDYEDEIDRLRLRIKVGF